VTASALGLTVLGVTTLQMRGGAGAVVAQPVKTASAPATEPAASASPPRADEIAPEPYQDQELRSFAPHGG
jgi:hypothetical protein